MLQIIFLKYNLFIICRIQFAITEQLTQDRWLIQLSHFCSQYILYLTLTPTQSSHPLLIFANASFPAKGELN